MVKTLRNHSIPVSSTGSFIFAPPLAGDRKRSFSGSIASKPAPLAELEVARDGMTSYTYTDDEMIDLWKQIFSDNISGKTKKWCVPLKLTDT
jgi:hypothetical protein